MPILVLQGLPGSGKSRRLVETVNAALKEGRPVLTFVCSDSGRLAARPEMSRQRLIGSRVPGLCCPLHHFVGSGECAELLRRVEAGTLVAIDEAHYFGPGPVHEWLEASRRGLELLIAMPSNEQLGLFGDEPYTHTICTLPCQSCGLTDAVNFIVVPGEDATLSLCAECYRHRVDAARREIIERLERQAPYPGEKTIYQPVEFEECRDWNVLRPDSSTRAQLVTGILKEPGALEYHPPSRNTYLDVGCHTGYFCHQVHQVGLYVEGVDVMEADIAVARLLDSYFRRDYAAYRVADCYEYLRETQDRTFDVTSAFAVFQWLMIQRSAQHGIDCLRWLFAKTRRICFLEMGYSSESQYQNRLPEPIDREWVERIMTDAGGFSEIRVIPASENGLMRDLFVGIKRPDRCSELSSRMSTEEIATPEEPQTASP
jgi:hypothetical protein